MAKNNTEWRSGRHVVYRLHVHLVFVTKYRRGAIASDLHDVLRDVFASVCEDFGADLLEYGGEDDHSHLLVAYPPKVAISRLVNSLKGVSARRIRALKRRDVQRVLWGAAFWSPSYCAVSVGGASLETVRQYVEQRHL